MRANQARTVCTGCNGTQTQLLKMGKYTYGRRCPKCLESHLDDGEGHELERAAACCIRTGFSQ